MESFILLEYETLRIVWWLLLGVLLAAFAVMDGADLGIAMLLPLVTRNDGERRVLYNVIGPVWEGNQVWLILSGGVIFAAWPLLYALSFSGFYLAMMLLLVALILRPVAIKYRSKMTSATWRWRWDAIWCATGVVAALVFGVAMGNVLLGVPFAFEEHSLRAVYGGHFFGLFQPFAVLCGVVSVLLLVFQGAVVLCWKADGLIAARAKRWATIAGLLTILCFVLAGVWIAFGVKGYHVLTPADPNGLSNPLAKTVINNEAGGWLANYREHTWMWLAPGGAIVAGLLAMLLAGKGTGRLGIVCSSVMVVGVVFTVGLATFPFLLPSSSDPSASLTIYDASASHFSLWVMLLISAFFLPIIVAYTSWVYSVMGGKVTEDSVRDAPHSY